MSGEAAAGGAGENVTELSNPVRREEQENNVQPSSDLSPSSITNLKPRKLIRCSLPCPRKSSVCLMSWILLYISRLQNRSIYFLNAT